MNIKMLEIGQAENVRFPISVFVVDTDGEISKSVAISNGLEQGLAWVMVFYKEF